MRRLLPTLALAAVACGHDGGPSSPTADDVRGDWTGTNLNVRIELHVQYVNGTGFSGTGTWIAGDTTALTFFGQRSPNRTSMTFDFGRQHRGPQTFSCDFLGIDNPSCQGDVTVAYTADLYSATHPVRMTISR
jgi:hypothetical protein